MPSGEDQQDAPIGIYRKRALPGGQRVVAPTARLCLTGASIAKRFGGFAFENRAFEEVWSALRPETQWIDEYEFAKNLLR